MRAREGVAAQVLGKQLGISLEAARSQVDSISGKSPSGNIPFSFRAKKALELSLREALQLGHGYIGTEHILLGLLREGESEGMGVPVLANLGIEPSRVRGLVLQALSSSPGVGMDFGQAAAPVSQETPAAARLGVEARRLAGSGPVGSHHYLLALVAQEDSAGAKALAALGATREAVEQQLEDLDLDATSDEATE